MSFKISNDTIMTSAIILPFVKLENVFTEEEMDEMVAYFKEKGTIDGKIGTWDKQLQSEKLRKSQVGMHYPNADTKWMFDRLNAAVQDANDFFYQFNIVGYDYVQFTEYCEPGDHYAFHTDMSYGKGDQTDPHLHRKLSFSLILSDPADYQGGAFEFLVSTIDPVPVPQKRGDLIVFPSFVLHKVSPVTSGSRKSLVGWILGPKLK